MSAVDAQAGPRRTSGVDAQAGAGRTFGFHGRYWRFDLSRGEGEIVPIDPAILRRTLGGVGLGAWLLHREGPVGVDPLAPEAALVFAFSPLVGTGLTTSAKFAVVARSPLTGGISDALASSHFAIAGKRLGIDAIVLVGACDEPSELVDGALRPTRCWGRSAAETAERLRDHGRVAAIGVAGERLVRFATISADGRHAGRGGLGAVMGSKRLKAIAVDGNVPTPVADPTGVEALAATLRRRAAGDATAKYRDVGTAGNMATFDRLGALPTRNFQQSGFEGADRLSAERLRPARGHRRTGCASCTIGCEHRFAFGEARRGEVGGGRDADGRRETRVEYESLFALGPLCGVGDPDHVLAASARCDALGLDTISAGATLAFAMECGDRGLLADGPRFGDGAGLERWLEDVAHRRGLGDRLAEGSRRLAWEIGGDAIAFAPQVKGLELPGYEPRALQAMALGLAVGTRGADHNRSSAYELDFSEEGDRLHGDARSAAGAVETEDRAALLDALILCKFVRRAFDDVYTDAAALLRVVTGMDFDADELRAVARRIVTLRKLYNVREGWKPEDDTLPERFLSEAIPTGPVAGARLPRERLAGMIRSYNLARGWTADGHPTLATSEALRTELDLDSGSERRALDPGSDADSARHAAEAPE